MKQINVRSNNVQNPSFSLLSWDQYYDKSFSSEESFEDTNYTSQNNPLTPSKDNAYIYNCCFYDMASDYGAAIFSTQTSNLLVERCTISECTATNDTAGIRVTKGNCIITFTCGHNTEAKGYDGFSAVHSDSTRKINYVFDSSISHCEANIENTMVHNYGHVYIKSVNLSNNKASIVSALRSQPNKNNEETDYVSDISYCSFSNNTATVQYCIYLTYSGESNKYEIKNSNIIGNNSSKTIGSHGETSITKTCILHNLSPSYFTSNSQSSISLYYCTSDNLEKDGIGSVQIIEKTNPFVLGLVFIETGSCVNVIEKIGNFIKCQCTKSDIFQLLNFRKFTHQSLLFLIYLL